MVWDRGTYEPEDGLSPDQQLARGEVKIALTGIKLRGGFVLVYPRRLDEHVLRALNKIKKASTAEEITELLNRDLDPGDRPFQTKEIETWLQNARNKVARLYWLETRPRR
jgi:hypothetical protein